MCTQPYARLALHGQDRWWTCPLTLQTKTVHQRIGAGISTTLWERKPDCTGPHTPYRTPFSPQIRGGAYGGGATTVALKLLFSPLFVCLEAQPRLSRVIPAFCLGALSECKGTPGVQQQREAFPPPWTTGLETHTNTRCGRSHGTQDSAQHTGIQTCGKPSTRWWVPQGKTAKEEACGN